MIKSFYVKVQIFRNRVWFGFGGFVRDYAQGVPVCKFA